MDLMRKLEIPYLTLDDIFYDLTYGIQKKKLINGEVVDYFNLFELCKDRIVIFEEFYRSLASTGELYLLKEEQCIVSRDVGFEEMKYLYEERLRKKFNDSLYTWLKTNDKRNFHKCSYCEQGDVSELDHLLPQSKFPIFAVTPINLIPSCHECNLNKLDDDSMLINPYFEDTTNEHWLICNIISHSGICIAQYRLDFSNTQYTPEMKQSIRNIYENGKNSIMKRYSIWGNNKLADKITIWKEIFRNNGSKELIKMLKSGNSSRKTSSKNSYESSLYEGMIKFIDSGGSI